MLELGRIPVIDDVTSCERCMRLGKLRIQFDSIVQGVDTLVQSLGEKQNAILPP